MHYVSVSGVSRRDGALVRRHRRICVFTSGVTLLLDWLIYDSFEKVCISSLVNDSVPAFYVKLPVHRRDMVRRVVVVIRLSTFPCGTHRVRLTVSDTALPAGLYIIAGDIYWVNFRIGAVMIVSTCVLKLLPDRVDAGLNQPLIGHFLARRLLNIKHGVRGQDFCLRQLVVTNVRGVEGASPPDGRVPDHSIF